MNESQQHASDRWPHWIPWAAGFVYATVLGVLLTAQHYFSSSVMGGSPLRLELGALARTLAMQAGPLYLWLPLCPFIFEIASKYPVGGPRSSRNVVVLVTAGVGFALLHSLISDLAAWSVGLAIPAMNYAEQLRRAVIYSFATDLMYYVTIVMTWHAINYFRAATERELRAARLQARLAQVQLRELQAQLSPHFLFNALNASTALISDEPESAEEMLTRLSELLRLTLHPDKTAEVPLERELEILSKYLEIQKIRFKDRLNIVIDVPAELSGALVPTLILQPLVENAIEHGVARRDGSSRLRIRARLEGASTTLEVQDDGPGLQARGEGLRPGVGLANTRARLEQLYGGKGRLSVGDAPAGGVLAAVELPYHTTPAL